MPINPNLRRWYPKIRQYAAKHGVPPELLATIVNFESGGDPNAGHKVSGATGLGQVMPREAGFPGRPTRAELLDPDVNLDWSARILADGFKRWKTPQQAAAAYLGALDRNGNVTGAADANGTTGHAYVARIMGDMPGVTAELGGAGAPSGAAAGAPPGGAGFDLTAFLAGLPPPGEAWANGQPGGAPQGASSPPAGGARVSVDQRSWPVEGQRPGSVLNPFGGQQFHSSGSEGLNLPASNTGADLVAGYGQNVIAETGGRVIESYVAQGDSRSGKGRNAKENFGYGGSVTVQYDDGTKARYSHMATGSNAVQVGQRVAQNQLLGKVGDSGNATGPHVDYMFWNAAGQLVNGANQNFVGGKAVQGPGGQGFGGMTPQIRAFLDQLPPPGGAPQQNAQPMQDAQLRQYLATLPPPAATPDDYQGTPGMRDAAFKYGRDEPAPTPWDYQGTPGLRDAAFVRGRDDQGTTMQPLVAAWRSDVPTAQEQLDELYRKAGVNQNTSRDQLNALRRQAGLPPLPAGSPPPRTTPTPTPTPSRTPSPVASAAAGLAAGSGGQGSIWEVIPPSDQRTSSDGLVTPEGARTEPDTDWGPGGPPPAAPAGPTTAAGAATEPSTDWGPGSPQAAAEKEQQRKRELEKYGLPGEPDPGPPDVEAGLKGLRQRRAGYNEALATAKKKAEQVDAILQAPEPQPGPGENPNSQGFIDRHKAWADAKAAAQTEAVSLRTAIATHTTNIEQTDGLIRAAIKEAEAKANQPGGANNPNVRTITLPDGRKIDVQWFPDPKHPQGGTWQPLPGIEQGAGAPAYAPGSGQHVIDAGDRVVLVGPGGEVIQSIEKTNMTAPTVIGGTDGPELTIYDPRTQQLRQIKNSGYQKKADAITAGDDVEFIVTQDETGGITYQQNPNWNPWNKDTRIEGKGAAEGKVMFVDRQGRVTEKDLLSPAERKDIADKAHAETEGIVADTASKKLKAELDRQEAEALKQIDAAIDANATPAQIRGLIAKAAKSAADLINLQNAETQRLTQAEAGRHNLQTEEMAERERRTAETAQASSGAASYAQYGVATAPFQTALLGSLSQVSDPRKVGESMRIDEGVIAPVEAGYKAQQQRQTDLSTQRAGATARLNEPSTSPYTPANPAAPAQEQPAQPAQPAQPGGAGGKKVDPNRAAVDLKDQGKPGWARTYYDDGSYEDWQIPGANPPMPAPAKTYTGNVVPGGAPGSGPGLGGGQPQVPPQQGGMPPYQPTQPPGTPPGADAASQQQGYNPAPGAEAHGVGGYFVGGGAYAGNPGAGGGELQMAPMYIPRYTPGGAGVGGGGSQGPDTGEQGGQAKRRRLPVPGKHAMVTGDPFWARTEYDDGAVEDWHVEDGPSWEGVGGGGAGYWGEDPPAMHQGWDKGTAGGGGSLWTLPPPASTNTGYGAQLAMTQQQQGVAPSPGGAGETPAGTSGGFAGPGASTNSVAGGGGSYGAGGGMGGGYGAQGASGSVFSTNAPSSTGGQRQAPMWDAASPAPFVSSGVAGPSGAAGQSTLYAPGASSSGGGGGGAPSFDPRRAAAPPKTNGSYYGGPGVPQAMSPLQRLLQQSGVIPLTAGRATGMPGTV